MIKHYSVLHEFKMGTHTGTHVDTPAHIFSKGKTLSDFPLTSFMGRFIKVDRKNWFVEEDNQELRFGYAFENTSIQTLRQPGSELTFFHNEMHAVMPEIFRIT